ncbi:MAG: 16S rRNA (guanine(527)-N(7))-methyltransferase RsmG [Chloroflexota bacterium]|nr:16S rRNA (guanine(527)-N(7))-methyltransferase RsmG [Chloroflexota bacterium]
MSLPLLADHARAFGIELSPAQIDAFELYFGELVTWNSRFNLTTITERDEVVVKHFLDSLSVAPGLPPNAVSLIDIGSGAGFPGLPLKIVFPALRVTLIDSTGKKVEFLKHIIAALNLCDATALHARAEELAHDAAHREQYDAAVARAVADLATLLEYALPFVRVGGLFIAQKGVDVDGEVRRAARAMRELGGRLREVAPVRLPGLEPRHLIIVDKIAATPRKYPRGAGAPRKKPIL